MGNYTHKFQHNPNTVSNKMQFDTILCHDEGVDVRLAALQTLLRVHGDDDALYALGDRSFLPRLFALHDDDLNAALFACAPPMRHMELVVKLVLLHGVLDSSNLPLFTPTTAGRFLRILSVASASDAVTEAHYPHSASRFHIIVAVAQLWDSCGRPRLSRRTLHGESTACTDWWHSLVASRSDAGKISPELPPTTALRQHIQYFHVLGHSELPLDLMDMEMLQALFTVSQQRGKPLLSRTEPSSDGDGLTVGIALAAYFAYRASDSDSIFTPLLDFLFTSPETTNPLFLAQLISIVNGETDVYDGVDIRAILAPYLIAASIAAASASASASVSVSVSASASASGTMSASGSSKKRGREEDA